MIVAREAGDADRPEDLLRVGLGSDVGYGRRQSIHDQEATARGVPVVGGIHCPYHELVEPEVVVHVGEIEAP